MKFIDILRPKWKNSDPKIRLQAVCDLKDENLLVEIIEQDDDLDVRNTAVRNLRSNDRLRDVALSEIDIVLCLSAVEMLEEQSVLTEIALGADRISVSDEAIRRITDENAIARLAINGLNNELVRQKVEGIKSPEILEIILESSDNQGIRKIVIGGVQNIDMLKRIAHNDSYYMIRSMAFGRLGDDQGANMEIAKHDLRSDYRFAAAKSIGDKALLSELAAGPHQDVRQLAAARLEMWETYEIIVAASPDAAIDAFVNIVRDGDYYDYLNAKIENVKNQEVLEKLITRIDDARLRTRIVELIDDQDILKRVVQSYPSGTEARVIAVKKLACRNKLQEIVKFDTFWEVRMAACEMLGDYPSAFKEYFANEPDIELRLEKLEEVKDQNLLAEVALSNKDGEVRQQAVRKIADEDLLEQLSLNLDFPEVRFCAIDKLEDPDRIARVFDRSVDINSRVLLIGRLQDEQLLARIVVDIIGELPDLLELEPDAVNIDGYSCKEVLDSWWHNNLKESSIERKKREWVRITAMKKIKNYSLLESIRSKVEERGYCLDMRDGKMYKTIKIGEQEWMAENLAFESPNSWEFDPYWKPAGTTGYYDRGSYHRYDKSFGRLYAFDDVQEACIPGWRVPSVSDWSVLASNLGGHEFAGKKMKVNDTYFWADADGHMYIRRYDIRGNNISGFSAVAAGMMDDEDPHSKQENKYNSAGYATWYWSCDREGRHRASCFELWYGNTNLEQKLKKVTNGLSLRLIKL